MVALAQILQARGATIRGTDTEERFYTDDILEALGIPVIESFSAGNLHENTDILFYSSAYDPASHPELQRAGELGIPMYTYSDGLGMLSEHADATGIAGVHGKSTSTALAGTIIRALELPATSVVGSMVPDFGDRAASVQGARFFVAETCEYRRHFLSFHPDRIMVTGVEPDHLDYYRDYEDIQGAFRDYAMRLSTGGLLVYCSDDPGAVDVASYVTEKRPDVRLTGYGYSADGRFALTSVTVADEQVQFSLAGFATPLALRVPGRHNAVNCAGVLALVEDMLKVDGHTLDDERWSRVRDAVLRFAGLKRRSEVVGEVSGITVLDDYAHHPTAIAAELAAVREFYPGRRLVIDFMSHTYSRTAALLEEFAEALVAADVLFLHRIYASAREAQRDGVTGRSLEQAVRRQLEHNPRARLESLTYIDTPLDAVEAVVQLLRPGDIFLTMGAGDNWQVGLAVLDTLSKSDSSKKAGSL